MGYTTTTTTKKEKKYEYGNVILLFVYFSPFVSSSSSSSSLLYSLFFIAITIIITIIIITRLSAIHPRSFSALAHWWHSVTSAVLLEQLADSFICGNICSMDIEKKKMEMIEVNDNKCRGRRKMVKLKWVHWNWNEIAKLQSLVVVVSLLCHLYPNRDETKMFFSQTLCGRIPYNVKGSLTLSSSLCVVCI